MNPSIPKIGWVALLCLIGTVGQAQTSHSLSVSLPMSKDRLNNGLLFGGAGLTYGFAVQREHADHLSLFEAKLGVQGLQRQGLVGVNLLIQPLSYAYGFRLGNNPDRAVFLGPKVSAGYLLQLYPDLQMGHVLWMSNVSLAPQLTVQQRVGANRLIVRLANSVVSLNSRPELIEPYYFSLRFTDLVRDLHSNLRVGTVGEFSQTDVAVEYRMAGRKRDWSIGYDLNYIRYAPTPDFQWLMHSATLRFYRK